MITAFSRAEGTGPGIVCFHANSSSSGQFRGLMDALSSTHRVMAFDAYGAGKTPPWEGPEPMRLSHEVALAEPLLQQAGEGVVLVGHSYGGAVAMLAALRNPGRIRAIAVYEPTLFSLVDQAQTPPNGADGIRRTVEGCIRLLDEGNREAAARVFIDFWSGEGTWAETPDRQKAAIMASIIEVPRWASALFGETTPAGAFARLACPILYMLGQQSPRAAHAVAEVLIPVLPDVRVVEFAGIGHMGPLTHAAEVTAVIADFVREGA